MSLDVEPPSPPELRTDIDASAYDDVDVDPGEYRREELETLLGDGAWEQAFAQWAEQSNMDEGTFAIATDLDLFAQFDFFWDDVADRVGYHAPGIPENWQEREVHPDLETWGDVSTINAELAEFGQIVCEVLKDEYVDWESEYEPEGDLPDFG
jgi:hypothetical protein